MVLQGSKDSWHQTARWKVADCGCKSDALDHGQDTAELDLLQLSNAEMPIKRTAGSSAADRHVS